MSTFIVPYLLNSSEPINGFVDDYAFLIRGLLDLYEACYDESWLQWACDLQEKQDKLFWDAEGNSGYFSGSGNDPSILLRLKEGQCKHGFCQYPPIGQLVYGGIRHDHEYY